MDKRLAPNFLYPELTYLVRGCAFRVYNELGFGHKESVYQKALTVEFEKAGISYKREMSVSIMYQGVKMGSYRPDFLVDEKIIVELKSLPILPQVYLRQVMNYLKGTGYYLALVINFGSAHIDIRRLIWTPANRLGLGSV